MASADVRDELLCSICLSTYTDPVTLRCGHSFCRVCIDQVLNTQDGSRVYSCPECREKFKKRPALKRNIALRNVAERFLCTQPHQETTGIRCTYCVDFPVSAVKSCLLCEVSVCKKHLTVHTETATDHVLTEPSTSLKNKKCSIHRKILEYYCTEDAACICATCSLAGEHRGHRVEILDKASVKKKKKLRIVLLKLITTRGKTEERVRRLEDHRRKAQENASGEAERVTALFIDIRRRVDDLEKKVLSEISRQEEQVSLSLSDDIQKLEIKKDELSRKMRHIEELCNMTDPLTVLQDRDTSDLCPPEEEVYDEDTWQHDEGDEDTWGQDGGDEDLWEHDRDEDTWEPDGADEDTWEQDVYDEDPWEHDRDYEDTWEQDRYDEEIWEQDRYDEDTWEQDRDDEDTWEQDRDDDDTWEQDRDDDDTWGHEGGDEDTWEQDRDDEDTWEQDRDDEDTWEQDRDDEDTWEQDRDDEDTWEQDRDDEDTWEQDRDDEDTWEQDRDDEDTWEQDRYDEDTWEQDRYDEDTWEQDRDDEDTWEQDRDDEDTWEQDRYDEDTWEQDRHDEEIWEQDRYDEDTWEQDRDDDDTWGHEGGDEDTGGYDKTQDVDVDVIRGILYEGFFAIITYLQTILPARPYEMRPQPPSI
ncbi:uncharacterized protein LOC142302672 [Anomaloglossus baeobatrachus]|uniref:uncharacterized protein LOC142302672 n=1 Tax=Anomaloglossus baeobatrachus TaxID=238106 RepID=UPI003F5039C1